MMLNLAVRRKRLREGYATVNTFIDVTQSLSPQMVSDEHMMSSRSFIQTTRGDTNRQ